MVLKFNKDGYDFGQVLDVKAASLIARKKAGTGSFNPNKSGSDSLTVPTLRISSSLVSSGLHGHSLFDSVSLEGQMGIG